MSDAIDRHQPRAIAVLLRGGRLLAWAVLHWLLAFAEQVLAVVAPLVLVCGLAWWALPRLVGLVPLEGPARDVAGDVLAHLPTSVPIAGFWVTPGGLIADGLLLMALAALLQTVAAVITLDLAAPR